MKTSDHCYHCKTTVRPLLKGSVNSAQSSYSPLNTKRECTVVVSSSSSSTVNVFLNVCKGES